MSPSGPNLAPSHTGDQSRILVDGLVSVSTQPVNTTLFFCELLCPEITADIVRLHHGYGGDCSSLSSPTLRFEKTQTPNNVLLFTPYRTISQAGTPGLQLVPVHSRHEALDLSLGCPSQDNSSSWERDCNNPDCVISLARDCKLSSNIFCLSLSPPLKEGKRQKPKLKNCDSFAWERKHFTVIGLRFRKGD